MGKFTQSSNAVFYRIELAFLRPVRTTVICMSLSCHSVDTLPSENCQGRGELGWRVGADKILIFQWEMDAYLNKMWPVHNNNEDSMRGNINIRPSPIYGVPSHWLRAMCHYQCKVDCKENLYQLVVFKFYCGKCYRIIKCNACHWYFMYILG